MWIWCSDTVIPNVQYGALKSADKSVLEPITQCCLCFCSWNYSTERGGKSMFVRPHVALTTAMDTCQGDYHKFCFCRDVLGIEECREEIITICECQRISHSAVCCCFSVFQRDVKKKWNFFSGGRAVEGEGMGRGRRWGATLSLWRNLILICTIQYQVGKQSAK